VFAEVRYFCELPVSGGRHIAAAVLSIFSRPRKDILQVSAGALKLCKRLPGRSVVVVELPRIVSIVAMIPSPPHADPGWYIVGEKMGRESDYVDQDKDEEEHNVD
jgi:hypothetical protein